MIQIAHSMSDVQRELSRRHIQRQSRRPFGLRPASGDTLGPTLRAVGTIRSLHMAHAGVTLGTGVAAWADQSGVGDANRNETQATGANQPSVTTGANFAGRKVLQFDGTDYLQSGTWSAANTQPAMLYFVFRQTSAAGTQIFNFSNTGANYHYVPLTAGTGLITCNAGSSISVGVSALNVTTVLCWELNGASSKAYINAITTPTATGACGAFNCPGFSTGASNTGANGFIGQYGTRAVNAGTHSAGERASVMNALGAYYGVTIAP